MKKDIKKMIEVAQELGWAVCVDKDEIEFSKNSPQGQDFNITITDTKTNSLESILGAIEEQCDEFDPSQEAYYWLDNSGHGTNGAPYNMGDLYQDMEDCLEMMEDLRDKLNEIE